ncbi:YgfZ/GcvT domain-containing protein [Legionella cardiaca]|uniref:Folate-binding protein YgfZ n=1 Tax=Legionella cardiaca TaxID=1071983 RepID=A0ABY8AXE7_9GAMM|nr:folate-binding protein YgfZ [Legionella cardiaca]WED44401.1 folate-binding protein YgfZ [Legionella cardiaca]
MTSIYLINQRPYTYTLSFQNEFTFQKNKNYLFELSHLGGVCVKGERAQEFLQGQLTCDVKKVTSTAMRQGAQCNLKGRILALLDVICWNDFQLILPNDLLVDTQNSLSKTAMLSRVTLEPANTYQIYGFYLNNPDDHLPTNVQLTSECFEVLQTDDYCSYYLGNNLYIFLVRDNLVNTFIEPFCQNQQYRGSLGWHYLQLCNKYLQIYPTTRGLFLPHRLDLHLSNYISFDKGCYKGQEIIARTHYRAKLKHGLRLFFIETKEPVLAGKKIFDASGNAEIGELIDFSPLDNNHYLIAASILFEHPWEIRIEDQTNTVALTNAT